MPVVLKQNKEPYPASALCIFPIYIYMTIVYILYAIICISHTYTQKCFVKKNEQCFLCRTYSHNIGHCGCGYSVDKVF